MPIVLVVLLLAGWAALLVADRVVASEVPRGTRVAGVNIGGRSRTAAVAALDSGHGQRAQAAITATAQGRQVKVQPADAGLRVDARRTVDAAARRSLNPLAAVRHLLGRPTSVAPRVTVDAAALGAAVQRIAGQVDSASAAGGITFRGVTPVVAQPQAAARLDQPGAVAALRAAYLRRTTVALPLTMSAPPLTQAEIDRALRDVASPAVAAPITVTAGSESAVLSPAAIAAGLTITPDAAGRLRPQLDGGKVVAAAGADLRALGEPGRPARFEVKAGTVHIVAEKRGSTVTPAALVKVLLPVIDKASPRRVAVPLTVVTPSFTAAEATRLGVRQLVSTFTTHHPCCAARVTNIHRIADIVDGYLVMPGETFSLNGFVGERTRAKGFVSAPMISDGLFADSVGGGVSQFATTLFNAVFFGGFEDVQHKPHSYWISRYPEGRESTVSFPQPDFRWRNDSRTAVLIDTSHTSTSLTINFFGTKRYDISSVYGGRYAFTSPPAEVKYNDKPGCEPSSGRQGWSTDVTRVFKQGGKVVRRQVFHTTYLPEPHVQCGKPPS